MLMYRIDMREVIVYHQVVSVNKNINGLPGLPKYGQSTFPLSKSSLPRCNEYSIYILRWKNSSYLNEVFALIA